MPNLATLSFAYPFTRLTAIRHHAKDLLSSDRDCMLLLTKGIPASHYPSETFNFVSAQRRPTS